MTNKMNRVVKSAWGMMIFGVLMISWNSASAMTNKIVLFRKGVAPSEISKFMKQHRKKYKKRYNAAFAKRCQFMNGAILRVPDTVSSAELAADNMVMSVEDDQIVKLQVVSIAADGGAADGGAADGGATSFITPIADMPSEDYRPWSIAKLHGQLYDPWTYMDSYDQSILPDSVQSARGPVKIAIFDTGVNYGNECLNGVVRGGINLINPPGDIPMEEYLETDGDIPEDDNGHGTHVTGLIAGQNIGLGTDFHLYAVKILDQNATGNLSSIIMALQWAIDHEINVVNMSIGLPR